MDNQILDHTIKTIITGTIDGENVIIDFENKPGILPTSVNAFCQIVAENGGVSTITINVGAVHVGSKTITVTGTVTKDRKTLIEAMKSTIEAILING